MMLANKTMFPSGNTIQKIRKMCFVFKLNGLKIEENNFLKRQAYLLQRMLVYLT